MMELTKKEKELIVHLLKKELEQVDTGDEGVRYDSDVAYTAIEENYEMVLKNLIKKIK
ncbi:hypothetical protein KY337_06225 [Candidatus Woesearchaeota archaeon]|nr:hypothetical protein [Candidatus Woesearchaeota archaeon]